MIVRRHNFTLIEILVVVVLISLLVGITIPAYTKIMTGNAVSYSCRIIASQLNMARVEACSKRKYVAVVFLNETGYSYKQDEKGIFNRRAYRACYVSKDNDFEKWVPGTKWETLPNGAFFASTVQGGISDASTVKGVKDDAADENDKLFNDGSLSNAVVFDTTGRPEKATKIVIMEGRVNSNVSESTLSDDSDNESLTKPNRENYAIIGVNQYSGRVSAKMAEE